MRAARQTAQKVAKRAEFLRSLWDRCVALVAIPDAGVATPFFLSGAWRFFNFLDADGSFTRSARPTLVASYHPGNDTSARCRASSCPAPHNRYRWWISDDDLGSCNTAAPFGCVAREFCTDD